MITNQSSASQKALGATLLLSLSAAVGIVVSLAPKVAGVGVFFAPQAGVALVVAIAFLGVLFVIPRPYLAAAALVVYVLIPVKFLKYPGDPGIVGPPLVVMGVWLLRLSWSRDRGQALQRLASERWTVGLVGLTAVAIVLATAVNPRDRDEFFWILNFGLSVLVAIVLIVGDPRAKLPVLATWEILAVALGAYGVVEAYVWRGNPGFDNLYTSGSVPLNQIWDVYRITTSLGHPLVNGTFFAGAVTIAIGRLIADRRRIHLVPAVISTIALFLTGSRGPAIAAVFGAIAIFVLSWRRQEFAVSRVVVTALVVIVIGLAAATGVAADSPLLQRAAGSEAQASLLYRQTTITDGLVLWRSHPLFGWGPGHADSVNRSIAGPAGLGLENGWIELIVALGVAGLVPFALLIMLAVVRAFTRGDPPAGALLMAMMLAVASFNFFEGQWPSLILFGIAVGCAIASDSTIASTTRELMGAEKQTRG